MRTVHLTKRFLGSLRPGGPGADAATWVAGVLSDAELALWWQMSGPDRRHSYQVARDVERALGHEATPPVLAAALLHDIGKLDAGLRTYGRVVATLSGAVAGHEMANLWVTRDGFTRRVGLYLLHPNSGADMLELAGSDPLTVAWTREHHLPEDQWTGKVPRHIAEVLKACDDD